MYEFIDIPWHLYLPLLPALKKIWNFKILWTTNYVKNIFNLSKIIWTGQMAQELFYKIYFNCWKIIKHKFWPLLEWETLICMFRIRLVLLEVSTLLFEFRIFRVLIHMSIRSSNNSSSHASDNTFVLNHDDFEIAFHSFTN